MVANDEAQQGIYPYLILIPQLTAATPRGGFPVPGSAFQGTSSDPAARLRARSGQIPALAAPTSAHWPWRVLEPVRHISVLFGQQAGTPDPNLHPAFRSANRNFHISRSPGGPSVLFC
jgi:hypothetical protein